MSGVPARRPGLSCPSRSAFPGLASTGQETGLAGFDPTGRLVFRGRLDGQLKVRGYRIELGEIEAMLAEHPEVKVAAVVAVRRSTAGFDHLVAYVVPRRGRPAAHELLSFLRVRLPAYMLPTAVELRDELPRTVSDKLDRNALAVMAAAVRPASSQRPYVAPGNAQEIHVAEVFRQVLGCERVGAHDDFFALGGHSLIAVQAVLRLRRDTGLPLSVRMLMTNPIVAQLARKIQAQEVQ